MQKYMFPMRMFVENHKETIQSYWYMLDVVATDKVGAFKECGRLFGIEGVPCEIDTTRIIRPYMEYK